MNTRPIGSRPSRQTAKLTHWFEDANGVEHACDFEFEFEPGYPESGPTYSSGGEPGEPDNVVLLAWAFRETFPHNMSAAVEAWWSESGEEKAIEQIYSSTDNGVGYD